MKDIVAGEDVFVCHRQTFGRLILIAGGLRTRDPATALMPKPCFLSELIRDPEEAQDLPYLVTEAPSSLATEASSSRKSGIPSSLATENPSSLVTEVSGPLATKALPAVETKAPSPLATEDSPSMATEAPPSLTTEVPSFLATHSPFALDEGPATFPKSTNDPISQLADKEASRTRMPPKAPESSLHPKMFLTGTREPRPHSQKAGKAEAELSPSSEVLASVSPVQDKTGGLPATLDHVGHTSSKSLSNSPNTSATSNAVGGRTLALQSSLPGKTCSVRPTSPSSSRMSAPCPQRGCYSHSGAYTL